MTPSTSSTASRPNKEYALSALEKAHEAGARGAGPVRHQRRHHARRSGRDRQGRAQADSQGDPGHPRPQRLGHGRGQLHRGRAPWRDPGPGHPQRLRRAVRQRQPLLHRSQPGDQVQRQVLLPAQGQAEAPHPGLGLRRRNGQHVSSSTASLSWAVPPSPTRAASTSAP